MPTPRSTYVDQLLTNVSVGYTNESYVAERLFPTVVVDKETGLYFVKDKENLRAPSDARRGEFSRSNRVSNLLSTAQYTLEEKSLEAPISDRVMRNYSDPFEPKKNATELVSEKLLIDNELDLQTTILAGAGTNSDQSNAWSTITTDIAGLVRTGRNTIQKNTGHKATHVLIGKPALDVILKNTAFLDSIKYTQIVTEEALRNAIAAYFDVKNVLIGDAIYNTAKEGQTDAMDYIWGDNVILAYVPDGAALETPAGGYRLVQKDARFVDTWYEQEIKTTFVRANDFYDNKIVDPNALFVYSNVAT